MEYKSFSDYNTGVDHSPENEGNGLGDSILWITMINEGYLRFTKNFLIMMRDNMIPWKLYVFCLDKTSYHELSTFKNCNPVLVDFLPNIYDRNLTQWGQEQYKKIVFAKLDVILHVLKSVHQDQYVGYIDTDIALFKDPTQYILTFFKENPGLKIAHQCDSPEECLENQGVPCNYLCSGCIVFQNSPSFYKCLQYSERDLPYCNSDQEYLQAELRKHGIVTKALPKSLFPNGKYYPRCDRNLVFLIHYNWMFGHEKEQNMIKDGYWFL